MVDCVLDLEDQLDLNISHNYVEPGEQVLSITLSNKASRETAEIKIIVDFDQCFPNIHINRNDSISHPLTFTQKEEIVYSATVKLGTCLTSLANNKIWSLWFVNINTDEEELIDDKISTDKISTKTWIEFEPRSLKNGIYKLVFNVTMLIPSESGRILTNEESTYFTVRPSPIFVVLYHYQSAISLGSVNDLVINPQKYFIDNNQPSLLLPWVCNLNFFL